MDAQSSYEKLPEQIQWKLYRAKQHYEELVAAVGPWMNADPGHLVPSPNSTSENPIFTYVNKERVPARFGLIAGDYLQNLRSSLDYLVWQLILANGKTPHKTNTAFPICKSAKSWKDAKPHRLAGVPEKAVDLIEKMQPYPERRNRYIPLPLEVLDELTNENKHRQVLFTSLASIMKPDEPCPFPHIELEITRVRGGDVVPGERLLAYLAFQEGIVKGVEVTVSLQILANYIGLEVLPLFDEFFAKN
jgi:hypothetical protein